MLKHKVMHYCRCFTFRYVGILFTLATVVILSLVPDSDR